MALTADQEVASIFAGTLFYGLYLSTLFHCLRWLVFTDEGWKVRRKIRWTMLSITITLFVVTTINTALGLQNSMVQVVIDNKPKPSPAPPPGSIRITTTLPWMAVVKYTDANVSILLADAVLIYRTWIIYSPSRRVIILPILLWIGGLVLTVLQAYQWKFVPKVSILNAWQVVDMAIRPEMILIPFWASTVILNGYSTFMIARRIYRVAKDSAAHGGSIYQFKFVMRVLIESGVLYIAVAIAHFVSWWSPISYAIYGLSTIYLSVTGIAFNLILIRVGRNRVQDTEMIAMLRPTSSIHFDANGTKSSARQFEVDTISAIAFRPGHPDSGSVVHDHISITASVV